MVDALAEPEPTLAVLFDENVEYTWRERLQHIIDETNKKFGKDTIDLASNGIKQDWSMKQVNRSRHYTISA